MDGKDLIASASDLQSFYEHQQHHHRPAPLGGGGGGHSQSSQQQQLAGMHSIIRPMPNMNMSASAILNSIGGMQFQMDPTPSSLLHNSNSHNNNTVVSVSGPPAPGTAPPPAEPVKRKRGRPRKYGPDGTMKASSAAAAAAQQHHQQLVTAAAPRSTMGSNLSGDMVGIEDPAAQKKKRGRPPGTGKKPGHLSPPTGNAFSGTAGTSFTPHIITASPSEDVAAKIVAFANQSSKAVCVLSAMGSVSRVVLRHTADASSPIMSSRVHASAGPPYNNNTAAIYEGFYEILSLSGSYSYSLSEGEQSGGLRVTLCSPERNVIGGVLAGPLVAASTVQVVLGSFHQGGSRPKSSKKEKAAAGKQQQQAFSSVDPLTGASPSSAGGGHNQNLTPPSVTTGGGWPSSGVFDTRSSSIDINSSRG